VVVADAALSGRSRRRSGSPAGGHRLGAGHRPARPFRRHPVRHDRDRARSGYRKSLRLNRLRCDPAVVVPRRGGVPVSRRYNPCCNEEQTFAHRAASVKIAAALAHARTRAGSRFDRRGGVGQGGFRKINR